MKGSEFGFVMISGSEQLLSLVFSDLYSCSLARDALVGSFPCWGDRGMGAEEI